MLATIQSYHVEDQRASLLAIIWGIHTAKSHLYTDDMSHLMMLTLRRLVPNVKGLADLLDNYNHKTQESGCVGGE